MKIHENLSGEKVEISMDVRLPSMISLTSLPVPAAADNPNIE
jgi:hypothetical protein